MAHNSTVLAQFLKLVPRHEFEALAKRHHKGRRLRSMTRWSQFVAMAVAQLAGRSSLRDIVSNLSAQGRKLYHLGVGAVARSSLARGERGAASRTVRGAVRAPAVALPGVGAGPRLPLPQPALLAGRDHDRPVPVDVPVGAVPAREGGGEAARWARPRRAAAGVSRGSRTARRGTSRRRARCACRRGALSRRTAPTWTSTGSTR